MQVTEKRNFMDIFYVNYFSHSLYLSRAWETFHVSREIMLNHLMLYMSHVIEKPVCVNMSHGLVGSSDPADACAVSVITRTGNRVHILVYMESYYISVVCKL